MKYLTILCLILLLFFTVNYPLQANKNGAQNECFHLNIKLCKEQLSKEGKNPWTEGEIWDTLRTAKKIWQSVPLILRAQGVYVREDCRKLESNSYLLAQFVPQAPIGYGLASGQTVYVGHPDCYNKTGYKYPGQVLAHEIGHVLNLPDLRSGEESNLMYSRVVHKNPSSNNLNSTQIREVKKYIRTNSKFLGFIWEGVESIEKAQDPLQHLTSIPVEGHPMGLEGNSAKQLLALANGKNILVYDLADRKLPKLIFQIPFEGVRDVSMNSRWIAGASDPGEVKLFSFDGRNLLKIQDAHGVHNLSLGKGYLFAAATTDGFYVYDLTNGLENISCRKFGIQEVGISSHDVEYVQEKAYVGSRGKGFFIYDPVEKRLTEYPYIRSHSAHPYRNYVVSTEETPHGGITFTNLQDNSTLIWNSGTPSSPHKIDVDKILAVAHYSYGLVIFDKNLELIGRFDPYPGNPYTFHGIWDVWINYPYVYASDTEGALHVLKVKNK